RDGAEIGDTGVPGRAPGATHVGPDAADLSIALLQHDPRRPRFTRAPRVVVVIPPGRNSMSAAAAVVAIERDVAAVAAYAVPRGEGEAHLSFGGGRHAVGQT